jgi:hypothetical protein
LKHFVASSTPSPAFQRYPLKYSPSKLRWKVDPGCRIRLFRSSLTRSALSTAWGYCGRLTIEFPKVFGTENLYLCFRQALPPWPSAPAVTEVTHVSDTICPSASNPEGSAADPAGSAADNKTEATSPRLSEEQVQSNFVERKGKKHA